MISKFFNFIYPPLCLHCQEIVVEHQRLFCQGCAGFFELIDPMTRCLYCFCENGKRDACVECWRKKRWGVKIASALDYLGAVGTLVKHLKYGRMPYLAQTAAALMLTQWMRLNWQKPDVIVPVPRRHWFQGMNHAHLIAKALANSLETSCQPLVKRQTGDFSQARLGKTQRENLPEESFYLKKGVVLDEKVVLLIDDVVTTGTTLQRSAAALMDGFPAQIFALSLARSIDPLHNHRA
jgi:competence protein ComFC